MKKTTVVLSIALKILFTSNCFAQVLAFSDKIKDEINNSEQICILTFYEGSPRMPLDSDVPDMSKRKYISTIGNTPSKHVTLILFSNDKSWIYKHIGKDSFFITGNNEFEFDSEYLFSKSFVDYSFCSKEKNPELQCVKINDMRSAKNCVPLFVKK